MLTFLGKLSCDINRSFGSLGSMFPGAANSGGVIYNESVNSKHQHPPGLTPGEFFKVVKFPAPRQKIFAKLRPGAKNRQKPRPWGQFCGPSRQFCQTIRIFLVLFFSLAFFRVFSKIIKLANT